MVFTNHETRNTAFIAARTAVHAARSLLSCALWRGMGRLWRGMGGILSPSRCPRVVHRRSRRPPGSFRCENAG